MVVVSASVGEGVKGATTREASADGGVVMEEVRVVAGIATRGAPMASQRRQVTRSRRHRSRMQELLLQRRQAPPAVFCRACQQNCNQRKGS